MAMSPPAPLSTAPAAGFPFLHLRNVLAVVAFALVVYLLWLGRSAVLLFLAGALFAILLAPLVDRLAGWGLRRGWASFLAVLLMFLAVIGAFTFLGEAVADQGQRLLATLQDPKQLGEASRRFDEFLATLPAWLAPAAPDGGSSAGYLLQDYLPHVVIPSIWKWASDNGLSVIGGVGSLLAAMVLLPFLIFWMLKDSTKIRRSFLRFVPPALGGPVEGFLDTWSRTLLGYFRGVLITMLFVFALDSFLLSTFTDIRSWLVLALIGAVLELLPMIGGWVATVIALLVGLVEGGPETMLRVLAIKMFVQVMENQVIVPRVMGKQLDIHPLTVLFFLLVGGAVGGIFGAVLSLPIAATLKVMLDEYQQAIVRRLQAFTGAPTAALVVAPEGPVVAIAPPPENAPPPPGPVDPFRLPPPMQQRHP